MEKEKKKYLFMPVGLPRSGKSTWSKGLMEQGVPVVNPDSIRLSLHGMPYISSAEPFVWATAKLMVKSLFLAGHDYVVLDATNTTRAQRDQWKSKDWVRVFEMFNTPTNECLRRVDLMDATEDHKEGLRGAIQNMSDNFEWIQGDEIEATDLSDFPFYTSQFDKEELVKKHTKEFFDIDQELIAIYHLSESPRREIRLILVNCENGRPRPDGKEPFVIGHSTEAKVGEVSEKYQVSVVDVSLHELDGIDIPNWCLDGMVKYVPDEIEQIEGADDGNE